MAKTISEEIAHMCLQWHECVRDGREAEADELREAIQVASDRVALMARMANEREPVVECGVS